MAHAVTCRNIRGSTQRGELSLSLAQSPAPGLPHGVNSLSFRDSVALPFLFAAALLSSIGFRRSAPSATIVAQAGRLLSMSTQSADVAFTGSIPALYHQYLGPLLFEPYATDLATRASAFKPHRILETAAGTGIVTAALAQKVSDAEIVVTDLNQAMLDVAAVKIRSNRVTFQQADAQDLPFPDSSFDLVLCQFGAMFFLDRAKAYREAQRVLEPGGHFLFNVWDRIERNPVSATVAAAVADCFPDDPPNFLCRTPFGYHDAAAIAKELEAAGFAEVVVETVEKRSSRPAAEAAIGICHGSPLRGEIEERDPTRLDEVTDAATEALAHLGDVKALDAPMSAHVFVARR
jgi:ubiquinone/menaquinone biosynthesis C-methylase UbiE